MVCISDASGLQEAMDLGKNAVSEWSPLLKLVISSEVNRDMTDRHRAVW